ncbi:hypothetical protein [Atlantibacter hermannii]|uniref:hypothetical protein n=1 Tax=Atlantibacter hermannii TaxID=565 RepID=UPI0028A9B1B7|nr:hypothetical protein [Atlantibacter hermannii]
MNNSEFHEYLVLGGIRHGEVWTKQRQDHWQYQTSHQRKRDIFYDRTSRVEIALSVEDAYFITEWVSINGNSYLIASTEPLLAFNIEAEMSAISPPLKPFLYAAVI